jgi:hypothetical protein
MKYANSIVAQLPYVQEFRGQQEEVAGAMSSRPGLSHAPESLAPRPF